MQKLHSVTIAIVSQNHRVPLDVITSSRNSVGLWFRADQILWIQIIVDKQSKRFKNHLIWIDRDPFDHLLIKGV